MAKLKERRQNTHENKRVKLFSKVLKSEVKGEGILDNLVRCSLFSSLYTGALE